MSLAFSTGGDGVTVRLEGRKTRKGVLGAVSDKTGVPEEGDDVTKSFIYFFFFIYSRGVS